MRSDSGDRQNHDPHDDDLIQLVTFRIGEEEFGVDILCRAGNYPMMQITMVPPGRRNLLRAS